MPWFNRVFKTNTEEAVKKSKSSVILTIFFDFKNH